jgi:hypothetical protein
MSTPAERSHTQPCVAPRHRDARRTGSLRCRRRATHTGAAAHEHHEGRALAEGSRVILILALAVGFGFGSRTATAAPPTEGTATATATRAPATNDEGAPPIATLPAPAVDPAEIRRQAGRAFRRGVEAYGANDFTAAIQAFELANDLVPHPDTVYNLALAVQASGDLRRAYTLFLSVERTAADPELIREARRGLVELRAALGVVVVYTAPGSIVCVDGQLVPPQTSGLHEVGLTPGDHAIAVHDVDLRVEVRAGESRTLWLDRVDAVAATRRRRTSQALTGAAIGLAAVASGLAVAAVATEDRPREGLEIGAATAGGLSAGTLIALLAHERAHSRGKAHRRARTELLGRPRCGEPR